MSENNIPTPQKWLIVFLIYADFTDDPKDIQSDIFLGIDNLFEDILTTPIHPKLCRVCVMMDSASYHNGAGGVYIKNTICLYEIDPTEQALADRIKSKTIVFESDQALPGNDTSTRPQRHLYQSAGSLGEILSNIKILDGEEILFVTWDHGAGFGIFPDDTEEQPRDADTTPTILEDVLKSRQFLSIFWNHAATCSLSQDFLKAYQTNNQLKIPDILDNSELAEALFKWLFGYNNERVGVLLMMNCWMMNLHTIYALKKVVTCLVAAQTQIGNPGYDYPEIIRFICSQNYTAVTPEQLAIRCADSRNEDHFRQRALKIGIAKEDLQDAIDDCIVIPMNLQAKGSILPRRVDEQFEALETLINVLFQIVESELKSAASSDKPISDLLWYTRPLALDLTKGDVYLIDIHSYFTVFSSVLNNAHRLPATGQLKINAMNQLIIELNNYLDTYKSNGNNEKIILGQWEARSKLKYFINRQADYIPPRPTGSALYFNNPATQDGKTGYNIKVDKLLSGISKWIEILELLYKR